MFPLNDFNLIFAKENNAMKMEIEYRANVNQVYEAVKKRLVSF